MIIKNKQVGAKHVAHKGEQKGVIFSLYAISLYRIQQDAII